MLPSQQKGLSVRRHSHSVRKLLMEFPILTVLGIGGHFMVKPKATGLKLHLIASIQYTQPGSCNLDMLAKAISRIYSSASVMVLSNK